MQCQGTCNLWCEDGFKGIWGDLLDELVTEPPSSPDLDFFVLFSSCGQLLGFPGQASYASGNSFALSPSFLRDRAKASKNEFPLAYDA
jgi:hypothetical protein